MEPGLPFELLFLELLQRLFFRRSPIGLGFELFYLLFIEDVIFPKFFQFGVGGGVLFQKKKLTLFHKVFSDT